MNKQEIEKIVKNAVNAAVDSQKKLTHDEKVMCIAAAAVGISAIAAMKMCAKMSAMTKRVKKCEKRLDDLENMCTDPNT